MDSVPTRVMPTCYAEWVCRNDTGKPILKKVTKTEYTKLQVNAHGNGVCPQWSGIRANVRNPCANGFGHSHRRAPASRISTLPSDETATSAATLALTLGALYSAVLNAGCPSNRVARME